MPTPTGYLTTHVLDTARGVPAAGMEVVLYRIDGGERVEVCRHVTNAEGRTSAPLLASDVFAIGDYELFFDVEAYFATSDRGAGEPGFFSKVPIRFRVTDLNMHYHVPLLISPFGYSTYRGS